MSSHRWNFYASPAIAWEAMLESCRHARQTIDLEQFAFGKEGRVERAFADTLIKKAREGLSVRLLFDTVGSFAFYHSDLQDELAAAGVAITFHHGVFPVTLKRVLPMFLRDHRKLLVVDGRESHIGGVIIEERARPWRDTNVCIEGGIVSELQYAFDLAWRRAQKMRPVGSVHSLDDQQEFSIAGNGFRKRDKNLYRLLLQKIAGASDHVYITTPYFLPPLRLRRALYRARNKGADVRILLPKQSDNFIADHMARLYYRRLLRHGIRLYLYVPAILHAKTIVVDGQWGSVGSCNFDLLSFWLNYELNLNSTNQVFVAELRQMFLDDLANSEELHC